MDKMTIEIKFGNQAMQDDPIGEVKRMVNDALESQAIQGALGQFVVWPPIILRDTNGNGVGVIRFEETWQPNYDILRGQAVEIDDKHF